ncbi:hypothetical protein TanjilG_15845 [Lupinus angustifolius]|uniref:Cotton fiber protein n=1 Tax=Lupinus angustifolius TaxID=3871 RepID=A0A1J7IFJ0_LUPAN|nr:PREDICTED: uncharacterized protein LOC109344885 [Lupinus angustifolius]OIW12925.1 hypothetical protein TanjilG_15845 [Lupinus angustifolius]
MARKRCSILHNVSNLLSISLFLHKLRKPLFSKLKKLRKHKELKLLRHYNYDFHGEYEFSPSTTPLIHYQRTQFKNKREQDMCSFFYLYWCLGNLNAEEEYSTREAITVAPVEDGLLESWDEASESVDERAEKFIERFYMEMRMQRRESL